MGHICAYACPIAVPIYAQCCSHMAYIYAHVCPNAAPIWPIYTPMHALLLLPCGLCMPPYMAHVCAHACPICCSHVAHVCAHACPIDAPIYGHICAYICPITAPIWPIYKPITALKYGLFLPAYRLLLQVYIGYYCASPN